MAFAQTKLKFSYRLHAGYVFNAHSKKNANFFAINDQFCQKN